MRITNDIIKLAISGGREERVFGNFTTNDDKVQL
jgi:hypothetical protein